MVLKPSRKRPVVLAVSIVVLVAIMTYAIIRVVMNIRPKKSADDGTEAAPVSLIGKDKTLRAIDFQDLLNEWNTEYGAGGRVAAYVYDVERDETVGKLNETEKFELGTLSPFFLAYEEIQRLSNPSYGYNSSDIIVASKNFSRGQCVNLALTSSNEYCTNAFIETIGMQKIDELIKNDYELLNSDYASSTAEDLAKMWKLYIEHKNFSATVFDSVLVSLRNQPDVADGICATVCYYRNGLPAGFSDDYGVFNKVGWKITGNNENKDIFAYYHDVAMISSRVYDRHFVIIMLTEGLAEPTVANSMLANKIQQKIEAELSKKDSKQPFESNDNSEDDASATTE